MAIFKCKMCGAPLEIGADQTTVTCEYCFTKQTLPKKLESDRRANLYDRANHFRRSNEFDKAMSIYESILNDDVTDSEAYWSLVLCRYGIEYVEDPATKKRIPTVNRAQFTSIFDDDNYKSALQYADDAQKAIYQQEANTINEIQKGILAISQKEEPFDVFICYKETDQNGRRTQDSVLANDLYHQLTAEGFKVFFSRITLEDKLGVAYEPYIFAALNSAKVMVVLGTKPEYFNAVWVKNEWSRYLTLVKQSAGKKILIPAYRDMDPYDLPEEFSHLQAQDMSKLGFMQDLIRGIKKLIQDKPAAPAAVKETVVVNNSAMPAVAPLLKRVFMYLEDREWHSADEYCEKVLDQEPENADAYLGKLMAELKCPRKNMLQDQAESFASRNNYQKVIRFGSEELKAEMKSAIDFILERNETARKNKIYKEAMEKLEAYTEQSCKDASRLFESIPGWQDADKLAKKALEDAESARKDSVYQDGMKLLGVLSEKSCHQAAEVFGSIAGWRDADKLAKKALEDAESARKDSVYQDGMKLLGVLSEKSCHQAAEVFGSLAGWRDADEMVQKSLEKAEEARKTAVYGGAQIKKKDGITSGNKNLLQQAKDAFISISGFPDADAQAQACQDAIDKIQQREDAEAEHQRQLEEQQRKKAQAAKAAKIVKVCAVLVAIASVVIFVILLFTSIIPGKKYDAAVELMNSGKYAQASKAFAALEDFKDSPAKIEECQANLYSEANQLLTDGKTAAAAIAYGTAGSYSNAKSISMDLWNKVAFRDTISGDDNYTLGVKADGTVAYTGDTSNQEDLATWSDIIAISSGSNHIAGLKSDGTVVAAGSNSNKQCKVSEWTDIVAISAGDSSTVGLKSDGTVVIAGGFFFDKYTKVSDWTDIVAISAGNDFTVGLKSDGTVIAVGDNDDGQCNVSGWTDIVAIDTNYNATFGLKSDGTVLVTRDSYAEDDRYDVSEWTDIIAISANRTHTVGLKADGTVITAGTNDYGQCNVSKWTDIVAVYAAEYHTVGLRSDGTVVITVYDGYKNYGDRGIEDVAEWVNIKLPTKEVHEIAEIEPAEEPGE